MIMFLFFVKIQFFQILYKNFQNKSEKNFYFLFIIFFIIFSIINFDIKIGDWININYNIIGTKRNKNFKFISIDKINLPKCESRIYNGCLNVCLF